MHLVTNTKYPSRPRKWPDMTGRSMRVVRLARRACDTAGMTAIKRFCFLMLAASSMALAQTPTTDESDDSSPAAKPAPQVKLKANDKDDQLDSVYVEGKRWLFNRRTRYAHSIPEVDGPTITVTKKTSVVQLNDVP